MKRVVLIDDDRDDAELFHDVLLEIDATASFHHFEEPRQALQSLLGKGKNLPDFIFLDINMPVVSGWQCLTEFKKDEHLKNVPVIIFTTSSQDKEKETAKKLGADGFITKPSEYLILKDLLADVFNKV